jgi:hypothetical protein
MMLHTQMFDWNSPMFRDEMLFKSEYIKSKILDPLEITDYSFGETFDCSSGFFISPRHLLKYAGIFLQGGTYKGKGILEKKTFKKIKLGDAIIAATALVHQLKLVTRNIRDFNGIENLEIVDSGSV